MEVQRTAGLALFDQRQIPTIHNAIAFERQRIYAAENDAVAHIEIGQAPVAANIEAVLHNQPLLIPGIVVNRLCERVSGVELQSAGKTLVGGNPKAVVVRIAHALILKDVAQGKAGIDGARSRKERNRPRTVQELIQVHFHIHVGALAAEVADH